MKREDFFETLKPHRRSEYIDEELDMWLFLAPFNYPLIMLIF
jgi:hypothetical protein